MGAKVNTVKGLIITSVVNNGITWIWSKKTKNGTTFISLTTP